MLLYYETSRCRYEFRCSYDTRHVPKEALFQWDKKNRVWWTDQVRYAATLSHYSDDRTVERLSKDLEEFNRTMDLSRASAAPDGFMVPSPEGLNYFQFQLSAINFALQRPATLIADEMGLGKSIMAAGVINASEPESVLIVCPASLKINWLREIEKWNTTDLTPVIFIAGQISTKTIVIINYDIIHKHHEIVKHKWDLVIADEAHYVKNSRARRSKTFYKIKAKRKLLLTGTPILNRPIELFYLLKYLDKKRWPRRFDYALRYCNAQQGRFGWDYSGSSNLEELQDILRGTVMIRRKKSEVLKELPGKVRQIIELSSGNGTAAVERDMLQHGSMSPDDVKAIIDKECGCDYEASVLALEQWDMVAFEELAEIRHRTAVAKLPSVIAHIEEVLECKNKVVVFAVHHDVMDGIYEHFKGMSVKLTGKSTIDERQNAVDRFQGDPSVRLFVGSIKAAGVGITLTAGSTVLFAELDWVPANVTQAEDRCHRIGAVDSVHVQHLVIEGTIDSYLARTIVDKQKVIDQALDGSEVESVSDASREELEGEAILLSGIRLLELEGQMQALKVRGYPNATEQDRDAIDRLADCDVMLPADAALAVRLWEKYKWSKKSIDKD